MWKAKRIAILLSGLLVCLCGFAVYTLCLGIVDSLPVIPVRLLADPKNLIITNTSSRSPTDQRLELAFGAGSEELRRPLRLWLPDKGIAFAAGDFSIDAKDGRVRLAPFSVAIFPKSKGSGRYPEISTMRSKVAILTLDRPAANHTELANRKIIAVELQSGRPGVTIGNNRGTAEKTDDVDILVTNGSLFYEERRNLIWTEGVVCVTDHQTKLPTVVRGKQMEMFLTKNSGPNRPKQNAQAQGSIASGDASNIEKIVLHSHVEMHFWVDARAGFLGGTPHTKTPRPPVQPAPGDAPDKAQIIVKTGGMFVYDLTKETAFFESPTTREDKSSMDQFAPDQVHVQRSQKVDGKDKFDQLTCDRLDLQFRLKVAPKGAAANPSSSNKEIETAKAVSRTGNDVALALDSERMAAYGTEFNYRAGDLVNGPLMVLKGDPLRANKDGHMLLCKELHITGANRFGEGQKAIAHGPGKIDLLDAKNPEKEEFPHHVLWRDILNFEKVKEGTIALDLLTVGGEASFRDDQQKQELHAEKIMVWLRNPPEAPKNATAVGSQRQELHRVFAQERVRAASPEFIVRDANTMTMTFAQSLASNSRLPDEKPAVLPDATKGPISLPLTKPAEAKKQITEEKKPRSPIELKANDITAVVATLGGKKLKELVARGNVYVFQAGEKPGEKRVDITGQLLTVNKLNEKADLLVVHGDKKGPARVGLGEIVLSGAIVTVNQDTNHADVDGAGVMEMPTNKGLDGSETAKKNSRINVHWNRNMTFDGKNAIFSGGVQAQEVGAPSWLLCNEMWAVLDQTVSFREGEKAGKNAKIDRIICDKNVFIDDSKVDEKRNLVQRNILQGRELINNEDGRTNIVGPGQVRLLAKGSMDNGLAPPPGAKAPPAKTEWKLTHVKFRDHMHANNKPGVKTAKFYGQHGGIEVFHFPSNDIKATMDPDHPPKDGLFLRCEMLEVEARQALGRTSHIMIARQNVFFRTDQYQGNADIVKYDEANDIVIFEALNGKLVQMYQITARGIEASAVRSSKVLYNRRTGTMETEGVKSISN